VVEIIGGETKLDKSTTPDSIYATDGSGNQEMIAKADLLYNPKIILANTTLDQSYNGATVYVTATCNITIPTGLVKFNCAFSTFTGVTATFLTSGTTINAESDGDVMAEKSMAYLSLYSTNNFILRGGGLS
jgi:hypothetical protein